MGVRINRHKHGLCHIGRKRCCPMLDLGRVLCHIVFSHRPMAWNDNMLIQRVVVIIELFFI